MDCQAPGCTHPTRRKGGKYCRRHEETLRATGSLENRHTGYKNLEELDPEKAAVAMDALTDPLLTDVTAAAKQCGLSTRAMGVLRERLEKRYLPVSNKIKAFKTSELLGKIDEKIAMSLEYMDEVQFATAGLKDNAIAFSILVEKRQLLRGEPTQIFSVEERKNLNDLIPDLLREAKRRGYTYDVNPTHHNDEDGVDIALLPPAIPPEEALNTTAIHLREKLQFKHEN